MQAVAAAALKAAYLKGKVMAAQVAQVAAEKVVELLILEVKQPQEQQTLVVVVVRC